MNKYDRYCLELETHINDLNIEVDRPRNNFDFDRLENLACDLLEVIRILRKMKRGY